MPTWWLQPQMHDNITLPTRAGDAVLEGAADGLDLGLGDPVEEALEEKDRGNEDEDAEDHDAPELDEDQLRRQGGMLIQEVDALVAEASCYVDVPGKGPTHINTIMKWLNDDVTKVSADRDRRVQQNMDGADGAAQRAPRRPRSILVDMWIVGIGDDIGVKFNVGTIEAPSYQACLGRIIRMRKRGTSRRWLDYRQPIDLAKPRETLGELYFTCYWYKSTRTPYTFKYTIADMVQIHVQEVICPVFMTYKPEQDKYVVEQDALELLNESLRGEVEIELQ